MAYILRKRYQNHFGIDLKSSALTRPLEFASDMQNAQYRANGDIESRKGYRAAASSNGGYGLFVYKNKDATTGTITEELLCASTKLSKATTTTFGVEYTGSETNVIFDLFYSEDDSEYKCQIIVGTSLDLDFSLGMGFDEASTVTLASLKTAIEALSDFTVTITGVTTAPAAFLTVTRGFDLVNDDLLISALTWTDVNKTITSPFAGSETNKNSDEFENITSVQLQNCLYLSNGYDYVQKYDGQTLYRAGVPTPASLTVSLVGSGAITGSNYIHRIQYIQKDASGNLIEGNVFTSTSGATNAAADSFTVTMANVLAGTGFNTNCAVVNGGQATVTTITVDSGHTIAVGDTAYFYDAVSASYVEREVTAIAATTITIAGAAVTVADNAVISNNLRIAVYRSKTSGTTPTVFYLIAELPNNSFTATQAYVDNVVDASLGAQLIEPLTDRSAPPKGRYISKFRTQMTVMGNLENPNTFYWSDIESPEYFPNTGQNEEFIYSASGGKITGGTENNETFLVFLGKDYAVVSGDIANNNIRIDNASSDIGTLAHASINEIEGDAFFLSSAGPRRVLGGSKPRPIGPTLNDQEQRSSRIDPILIQENATSDEVLVTKRAIGFHDQDGKKYLLYIPCETADGSGDLYANSNSVVYAYDYSRDAWLYWNNLNMSGGVALWNGEIYFSERRLSDYTDAVEHILYKFSTQGTDDDYEDNGTYIDWSYSSQWDALEEPSVFKKYLRLRYLCTSVDNLSQFVLTAKTEVDYIEGNTDSEMTFDFSDRGYGLGEYGNDPYGDFFEPVSEKKLKTGKCKAIRVIWSNQNHKENPIITAWELEVATPFRVGIKE